MFVFDEQRAKRLLRLIYGAYVNEAHLYRYVHAKNGDAPQHRYIPDGVERGSKEHLIFLFFANLLTYHSQSDQGFLQVKKVYEYAADAFTNEVVTRPQAFIQELLVYVGFIYPNEGARRWRLSAGTLFSRYGGDPLSIFQKQSIDTLVALKRKENKLFVGLGPKLFSLLALFYEEVGVIGYVNGAFPVDLHVQAECIGMGIVTMDHTMVDSTALAEFLRKHIAELCRKECMSALDLSHAMWFLGNRVCSVTCKKKPRQAQVLCPVYAECGGRISTNAYARKGKWDLRNNEKPLSLFDACFGQL